MKTKIVEYDDKIRSIIVQAAISAQDPSRCSNKDLMRISFGRKPKIKTKYLYTLGEKINRHFRYVNRLHVCKSDVKRILKGELPLKPIKLKSHIIKNETYLGR